MGDAAIPDSGQAGPAATGQHRPFDSYRHLVFDCDGVVVDSNGTKEANIRHAALAVCDAATAERFVRYFVSNNGLPRETKIAAFFSDESLGRALLTRYNELNAATVPFIRPLPATVEFLKRVAAQRIPLYLLSGGDEREVRDLLENAGLTFLFTAILGAPPSKVEHLERLALGGPVCYFGDSRYDYEVASRFGFDFVFLSRYTQFQEWREFFVDKPRVRIAHDFSSIT